MSASRLRRMETALLIRAAESEFLKLFSEGSLDGTVHTCIGQELSAVAVAESLKEGDCVVSNHRCHGHFIARTADVEALVAEIMGKASGASRGRGGSQHLFREGFFSNGIQGGMLPAAAGLALSKKKSGRGNIAAVFMGDGTLGEGVVYETFNIAAKWELPLLIVLENNRVSQSTPQETALSGGIAARAAAFGIKVFHASTWESENLFETAQAAVRFVRSEGKPAFVQIDTDRLMAHSKGDDGRSQEELDEMRSRDPIEAFKRQEPEACSVLEKKAADRVRFAVAAAQAAGEGDLGAEDPDGWKETAFSKAPAFGNGRIVERINAALSRALESDPRVFLLGEDIADPYGGAFKATRGLSSRFPGRVLNTPVSEAAILGIANGASLGGFIPVAEFMFGDFLALAADQWINHSSKFGYMYGPGVSAPLLVRTPMGGRRGYGPTHSQSLEKHFLGLPFTRVLAVNHRFDPSLLYDAAFRLLDRPTLVIENKLCYAKALLSDLPPGYDLEASSEDFPTLKLGCQENPAVTILCWGGALAEAEAAAALLFEEDEIGVEIIVPSVLYPFNAFPLVSSLKKTGRLLVLEEGLGFSSLGAEAAAQAAERAPGAMKALIRLSSRRTPIPSAKTLEAQTLPSARKAADAVKELLDA